MQGKQILITGGTGGLGHGVTAEALVQGASLILPYVNSSEAERLKGVLSPAALVRIRLVPANLADESSVAKLFAGLDRVDALIHLVGGFSMGATADYSYTDWKRDLELNLHTTFLACKYALQRMQTQNYGRIVTIGSRGAVEPVGQLAAYCAAKAGVVALTRAIADETKGSNVTANVVLPSVIDTPSNRAAMGSDQAHQWVKPESLAKVICFLASEAARDLRGAIIPVYGNA